MTNKELIEELKGYGATESELEQLEELKNLFDRNKVYSKIRKLNVELLGEDIRPVSLNLETAEKLIRYGIYDNVGDIIHDYTDAYETATNGSTVEYVKYTESLEKDLQDIGVTNATVDNIRNLGNLDRLHDLLKAYKKYEQAGQYGRANNARNDIEKLLGA